MYLPSTRIINLCHATIPGIYRAGDQPQGFVQARHALHPLSCILSTIAIALGEKLKVWRHKEATQKSAGSGRPYYLYGNHRKLGELMRQLEEM